MRRPLAALLLSVGLMIALAANVDGAGAPISIDPWQLFNDTFTVNGWTNRANVLPGTSAFDTTSALPKIGLNIAQMTGNMWRYVVPGDTATIAATGDNVRIDLVFRISPGPGNYTTIGNRTTSLRRVPTSATPVNIGTPASPANFWEQYLINNGAKGTAGGHPAGAVNGGRRWSELVWNSAMCDSAEINYWPIDARTLGGPAVGLWSTMYNEADPKYTVLGLVKNRCFLIHPTDGISQANTVCDISLTDGWPTAAGYSAENGLPAGQTYEYTKILPDGQFTPGTHVEYFFRREDASGSPCGPSGCLAPDTNLVYPQPSEGSFDAHRWQEFSVLPDAWKKVAYGGLGNGCDLYVDLDDRLGDERVWVALADSGCGGTSAAKYGAHNGWHDPGAGHDINDPAYFVRNLNQQPGTSWDMFGVKASDSPIARAGTIGSWNSNHAASAVDGKWSYLGPSDLMLSTFYTTLVIHTGHLSAGILGPIKDLSSDDATTLENFMQAGSGGAGKGVWVQGDGFVESETGVHDLLLTNFFKVSLRAPSYAALTQVDADCVDIVPQSPVTSSGDIYGVRNGSLSSNDVLMPEAGGEDASHYSPAGIATVPVVSGVYHPEQGSEFWVSLVDGWDVQDLRSRMCDASVGRIVYSLKARHMVFGALCNTAGCLASVDDPHMNAPALVDFMNLKNNPLRSGTATVEFGLAKPDRVEVRIYDVAGRLLRTLADRWFPAGRFTLTWDGADNAGRQVAHGVYFTQVRYVERAFTEAKKLTLLK